MLCSEFVALLEREPDGPFSGGAVDHLDSCSQCRVLLEDLEGIRAVGLHLGSDEAELDPPERIWIAVRRQLESEGVIHNAVPSRPVRPLGWLAGWFGHALRPALVGVSAALLLAATALLNVQSSASPASDVPVHVAALAPAPVSVSAPPVLNDDLQRTLDGDMRRVMASLPGHRSSLENALRQNLDIVDNFIAVCEKSVREQPDNPVAREYLYGAYQQKAVLLSAAMDHTTLEGR